jgi:RNA polymerase sigma-70 factor (ECF subfamily)
MTASLTLGAIPRVADPDAALVQLAKKGDQRAFHRLFEKYSPRVRRLVSRHVSDADEVADVTQEAFIRAFRALPNFKGESQFFTWLYRIAVNTARNSIAKLRRVRRHESVAIEGAEDGEHFVADDAADDATPEALLASRQVAGAVERAVGALPEDMRTALLLREIDGLGYAEIAAQLGIPIGTVRSRIFRAREAVAAELRGVREDATNRRF